MRRTVAVPAVCLEASGPSSRVDEGGRMRRTVMELRRLRGLATGLCVEELKSERRAKTRRRYWDGAQARGDEYWPQSKTTAAVVANSGANSGEKFAQPGGAKIGDFWEQKRRRL
jgi:hypothetical protein